MSATTIPQVAQAQAEAAEREANEVLTIAKAIVVSNPDEFRIAGEQFAAIKTKLKDLEAQRVAITKPLDDAKKAVMDLFRRPKEALEAALSYYERPMAAYKREEDRKRREAEEAARLEREKAEREARERAAEEQRRLAEIQRQEEEARRAAEAAENPVAAFLARQKAEDLQAEVQAQTEATVDAIREIALAPAAAAPVYVPKATAAGVATRKLWKFEIVDVSLIPREYLIPDEKKIGELARTLQGKAALPGVRFFDEIKIGGR